MFSVIKNIFNKKSKGPTLMELFTVTAKLKKFFLQPEIFDVCTTAGTAHIDTIFTQCQHGIIAAVKNIDAPILTRVWQELE
jgi:hypothetical protein